MFSFLRLLPLRVLLVEQLPTFALSFGIAEAFYKFHSFTLECLAFLLTWFLLDMALQVIRPRKTNRSR
jgi:hypothetical protein